MRRILLLVLLVLLAACSVLEYRDVQRDFERAVQVDNEAAVSPFVDGTAGYLSVLEKLTPEYIAKLDARLQANAWMLRGVSAWRSTQYEIAMDAARQGKKVAGDAASRDKIVLTMLPGMVAGSEAVDTWRKSDKSVAEYEKRKLDLRTAWKTLKDADSAAGKETPKGTVAYVNYHLWRVGYDWLQIMIDLAKTPNVELDPLLGWAASSQGIGEDLQNAADAARDKTAGHPLRDLIRAQGG